YRIRRSNHRSRQDGLVLEQHRLDLGPGDVVAPADDQIIVPALEPEVPVFVLAIHVAGQIPSATHVLPLPLGLAPVTASGRASDGQQPVRPAWHLVQLFVDDASVVSGNDGARGPG